MPLRLDIKRKLVQRSDRVKNVELHPSEPWILANLYSGNIYIWNHQTNTLVKSFEVTELPVRTARFVARKQWIVCGSDDMFIRVYNYNTSELVKGFEAHTDYIRSIAVHPTLPYILTSSDDMLIKLWDWDKGWICTQIFEGHSHYVMQVAFNPKDTNTFASASLDRTIKVWSLGQAMPNFTLEGHEKGVNCVDYFAGGDRPYLISGADDKLVKIWDYQTKTCVQTLEGHTHNVSAVCFHPELPIIISGSEDGTLRIWHSTTYRLENTLNYGLERVWAIGVLKGSNAVAVGYDEGTVMFKIGREDPVASMDSSGKIIWARHNEIQTVNVKAVPTDYDIADGERLPLAVKDLGSCSDLYPQTLQHNPNGRFVIVCGDGEYIVYTALAWRNKSFGSALDFAWSLDASEYAVRESSSKVKFFKNFQEKTSFRPAFAAEQVYGGALVGLRSADFVCFYDWAECRVVRRIDVAVKNVIWSESGDLVAITSDAAVYILRYNRDVVQAAFDAGQGTDDQGIEDAFELLHEISEKVRTGIWVGDCFIYTNSEGRLNYCVGGEITTVCHLDRPLYLLGYLASQNRVYLIDKEFGVVSYTLLLSLIELKTLVLRDELEAALALLPSVPKDHLNGVARFLEARGHKQQALEVAVDPDYRFDLAVQMGDLATAHAIATESGSEGKWKMLGELAMSGGNLQLAESCLTKANDLSGLLLLYSSTGDLGGVERLAEAAKARGKNNVAFLALLLLKRTDDCVRLLASVGRIPEAAFLARTYAPSLVSEMVAAWRTDLSKVNKKAAEALADPAKYPNLFRDFDWALKAEEIVKAKDGKRIPAAEYLQHLEDNKQDLIALVQAVAAGEAAPEEAEEAADAEPEPEAALEAEEEEEEAAPPPPPPPPALSPKKEEKAQSPSPPPAAPRSPTAPQPPATPPPAAPAAEPEAAAEEGAEEEELFADAAAGEEEADASGAAAAAGAGELDDDWGLDDDK